MGISGPGSFFFSSRRRHTRFKCDWSSDVCSSDLAGAAAVALIGAAVVGLAAAFAPVAAAILPVTIGLAGFAAVAGPQLAKMMTAVTASGKAAKTAMEIGRASCRERV